MIRRGQKNLGFTIIEILVVIVVIGILSAIVYTSIYKPSNKAYEARARSEFTTMSNALKLFLAQENRYPEDVSRGLPAEINRFITDNDAAQDWPDAPYPGGEYDYDAWDALNSDGSAKNPIIPCAGPDQEILDFDMSLCDTYQISIRMCDAGDDATCKLNAQRYLSDLVPANVLANWTSKSAMFYCIKGACRSHADNPVNHPGYCVNCTKQPWQQGN